MSKVANEENADTERLEMTLGEKLEVLFVEKRAIITSADVKSAMRSPQQANALQLKLTDEGGKKLGDATKDLQDDMRIAVVIDGKVVTAPTVMAKLGINVMFDGLKEYSNDDLDLLGWQIEGKSDEEIAVLLRERQLAGTTPQPPAPKPDYYNDEEYAALKKSREKMGIFQLDELPTEAELDKRLRVGMEQPDVIAEFGKASHTSSDDEGHLSSMEYNIAPERRSISTESRPESFLVLFREGKVTGWRFHMWTDAPRQAKPPARGRSALTGELPQADFAAKDFNITRWSEQIEIKLKEGEKKLTPQDQADLISIMWMVAQTADDDAFINSNCSLVTLLAEDLTELSVLRKTSKDNKISLSKLKELVEPYVTGEKHFP